MPRCAEAHKLGADCKVNGNRVELEAYYPDDIPARDAQVRVEDSNHQLLAEGRTDTEGRWSFARPGAGTYRVIVDAGAGHRKEVKITLTANADTPSGTARSNAEPETASDGPGRAAFTAYPWLRLGIGVAILAALGGGFWIARRNTSSGST